MSHILAKVKAEAKAAGKRVTVSSTSTSKGSPKVATAAERKGKSGKTIGKGFPAQANFTQNLSSMVSAINRNPFLEPEEKRRAIRELSPRSSRRYMNQQYLKVQAKSERYLAIQLLEHLSPHRLERMKKEGLI